MIDETSLGNYLGKTLTNDPKAAQVVAAVNQWINTYTGRSFGTLVVVTDELQDYRPVVWTDHMDVVTIDKLQYGSPYFGGIRQVIPDGTYVFNPQGRVMINPMGRDEYARGYYDNVSIDYTYGVTAIPEDLRLAALALAADFYKSTSSSQGAITMAMVGNYKLMYKGESVYKGVLESYRARRM